MYLVDAVFVALLCSAATLDFLSRGWASTHGHCFAIGILSVACLAAADRLSAGIGSIRLVAAVAALATLPVFELAGGGALPHILAFLAAVSVALVFSVVVLVKVDRIQGSCALLLALWALAIGVSNMLSTYSYTGFWIAETT